MLVAGGASDNYSGFSFPTFVGITAFLNLPSLLYWLGFWIWGEGYFIRTLIFPFRPLFKEKDSLLFDPDGNHPWRRFFARWVDYIIWGYVVAYGLLYVTVNFGIQLPKVFDNKALNSIMVVTTWAIIESFFLAYLGKTPGKWLLGINVRNLKGEKLSFSDAAGRSGQVLSKGVGFGIPLIILFTMISSRTKLIGEGETSWDKAFQSKVAFSKLSLLKIIVTLFILAGYPYQIYESQAIESATNELDKLANRYISKREIIFNDYNKNVSEAVTDLLDTQYFNETKNDKHEALVYGYLTNKLELNKRPYYEEAVARNLIDPRKTFAYRYHKIAIAKTILLKAHNDILQTFGDYENEFNSLPFPLLYKKIIFANYSEAKRQSLSQVEKFFQLEEDILLQYSKIFSFLEVHKYGIQGNQFVFVLDEDVKEFNALAEELTQLSKQEKSYLKNT